MAEGVAEIERGAHAGLALVRRHDLGLVAARTLDGLGQRIRVAFQQPVQVLFEPDKKRRVADEAVLDDLGQPGREFTVGKRVERVGVDNHRARLVERADHVLAECMVHAGLAADRGVHLRQQRGRHLDERDTALIGRGGETGYVADHAAAEGDDRGLAVATVFEQRVEDAIQYCQRFVLFAIRQNHFDRVIALKMGAHLREIKRRHGCVRDDHRARTGDVTRQKLAARKQA